ncbi:MAG: protein kinase [Gemmatimonadaceae bacterium]
MFTAEHHYNPSSSLTTRAFVGSALTVLVIVAAVIGSFAVGARRTATENTQRGLEQSADLVAQFLSGRERTLVGGARVFVQNPNFRSLIAERQRVDVLDRAIEAAEQIGADWAFITDAAGVLIAKSDEGDVTGLAMGQVPLIAGALRGQIQSGFGASGDTMIFQAVALPISAKLGAPAGVLVATRVIDSAFLHSVKVATSSDLVFYTRDEKGRDHPSAATVAASAKELTAFLGSRADTVRNARGEATFGDTRFVSLGSSLVTAGGAVVGGFVVLRPRDDVAATFATIREPLLVALLVGSMITLFVTWLVARFVSRPAEALANVVARAAGGDLKATASIPHNLETRELRDLTIAFESLVNDLRDKEALIAVARFQPSASAATPPDDNDKPPRQSRFGAARTSSARLPLARQISNPGLVLEPGSILASRYAIEAEVGRGGLGIVYRALDRVIGEVIAIKILRPELVLADATAFEQLKLELRITRRLSHRNIVRTHDIGETADVPFLTMEYVDGASLSTIIQARGGLSRSAVLAMAKQLLGGLSVAHDHGIVHGDLKPQNLLIDANGLLKVTDFGVARLVRGSRQMRSRADAGATSSEIPASSRLAGAVVGTPEYMAPEQLIGEPSNVQTDLYAAGIVLNECLTGSTPYQADTPLAFVARKLGSDVEAELGFSAPDRYTDVNATHADIRLVVDSLMNPRPELRPNSARAALARFSALG